MTYDAEATFISEIMAGDQEMIDFLGAGHSLTGRSVRRSAGV